MNEDDIKTILTEPIPENKGPAKKNKKRNGRKKKEQQQQQEQQQQEQQQQQQEQEQEQQEQQQQQEQVQQDNGGQSEEQDIGNITVPINLSFIVFIRNLLTDIVPRTKWRAEEMAPVGMVMNELSSLIQATQESMAGEQPSDNSEVFADA